MDAEGNGWEGVTWSLTNNQGQTLDAGTLQNGYNALDAGCLEDGCYTLEVGAAADGNLVEWILETSEHDPVAGGAGECHLRIQHIRGLHHALGLQLQCGGLRGRRIVCVWGERSDGDDSHHVGFERGRPVRRQPHHRRADV